MAFHITMWEYAVQILEGFTYVRYTSSGWKSTRRGKGQARRYTFNACLNHALEVNLSLRKNQTSSRQEHFLVSPLE